MHWGFNPPSKTPPPLFCQIPHLNLQTVHIHPFFLTPPIPACLKTGFFSFSVNIPVILKLFLLLNISDFSFFLHKNCNLYPLKKSPPLSHQPSSKNWNPATPPIFENFVGVWIPSPADKKGGHTISTLLNFDFKSKVFGRTSSWNYRTSYFLLRFTEICDCSTLCVLVLFSIFLNALENVLTL